MKCNVSTSAALNATASTIHACGVAGGGALGVALISERAILGGSGVVCPPGGQGPRQFEHKNERDWYSLLNFIGLGG